MTKLVFIFAVLSVAAAHQASPVDKIVDLLSELKAKIETDGKAEQKVYDKFACWCEKTTAKKTASIGEAKTSIEELTNLVMELKGKKATLNAEIKQLEKDITANEAAQTEATSIRDKERDDYGTMREQSEQTIGALEGAVKTLTGAGEGAASALQSAQILTVAGTMRSALRRMPKDAIPEADMENVEKFMNNPTSFFSAKGAAFSGAQLSQNPFGDYAPASTAIQGTLKNMYDNFASNLEAENADEAKKQKTFEGLMATKSSELAALKATLENKQTTLGETSKNLADSEAERAATTKVLDDDEQFFEDTKEACKMRADQWAERSRLRTEELAGVAKALEILSGDEAAATFGRATSMFLQTAQKKDDPRARAFKALNDVAKKVQSSRLAALATSVKTGGHFKVVIKSLDKMLGELRDEEQADIDQRDWCQEHEHKFTNQKEDLEYKVGQTEALIERLTTKSGELENAIANSEKEILETQESMAEALATRNEENAEFKAALKDDTDSVALLASAMGSLAAFEKNNKISLLAKKADPEGAPSTGFDTPYGGRSSETGGIVGIITMLKEDLENEIADSKFAEKASQDEFSKQRAAAKKTVQALKSKKTQQQMQKADTDEKKSDAEGVKSDTETMAIEKQAELDSIEPNCSWIKGAFEERRTKRKAEMDGMITGKAVLAGQAAPEKFLQQRFA